MNRAGTLLMVGFGLFAHTAVALDSDSILDGMALREAERSQHRNLALSLRNQQILEKQAESKARQLMFQLQAAEALSAIQNLSRQQDSITHNSDPSVRDSKPDYQIDLERMTLAALLYFGDEWFARILYGSRVFFARDGDVLLNQVNVQVRKDGVTLVHNGRRHRLQGESSWTLSKP
ncbi:hypothetical protein [Aliidiomarina sanyensis]|uniref:hypothetical protein n=1 Tax=Aliidiomarina sanyensis TaxID=1249555 RepID=UPI001300AA2A|nr:hypothetical protein [Aliidiomarina sanyensis]